MGAAVDLRMNTRVGRGAFEDPEPESGVRLGRFELLQSLGLGGVAEVYRAYDRGSQSQVALKIPRSFVDPDEARVAFHREFHFARRVVHPNVVQMHRRGRIHDVPYLAMACVDGESLADVVEQEGKLHQAEALYIVAELCRGVAAIHEAGIVHCDLKPDNILVSDQGNLVIADFGIARPIDDVEVTGTGLCGSPAYMAPEQVTGGVLGPLVDIFAIGVVLFELLTGHRPWPGDAPRAVALRRLVEGPPDPRVWSHAINERLASLVLRCLERRPEKRPRSADELRQEIVGLGLM